MPARSKCGEPVTTATDVYSLGVLLYELLCGVRPYRTTGSVLESAQAICLEAPATMASRSGKRIGADLENIVQKALRKEPARRYISVEQFSEDIRRYLEGYAVAARPDTKSYRARKFAGRNKLAIAAGALVVLTLLGGIAATAWQAHLANQRFEDVRELADAYLFEFHDAIKDLPGSTPARQLVVKRGIQYLDKLAQQRGNDSSLSRELAKAYAQVGSVQGAPNTPSLGDRAGALVSYRKSLAIREPLEAKAPQDEEIGGELSDSYTAIAELLQYSGDLDAAAANFRKSQALLERLARARPASVGVRTRLATADMLLGSLLGNNEISNLGDTKGAMELSQKSRILFETLSKERPADRELRVQLSSILQRLAALYQALDNKEESIASFRRSLPIEEQLIREEPLNVMYRRQAAISNRSLALVLLRVGGLPEARQRSDRSAELFDQLAKEDPANAEALEALADSQYSQGYVLQKGNEPGKARTYYEASIATYNLEMSKNPATLPAGLRTAYQLMADLGIKTKDVPLALRNARRELEVDGRLLTANAHNASAQRNQGTAYGQIGQAHEVLARRLAESRADRDREWREARVWYRKALDVWVQLRKDGVLIPGYAPRLDESARSVENCDRELSK
jgi:tetratricopeptide (TPR) repeat protein